VIVEKERTMASHADNSSPLLTAPYARPPKAPALAAFLSLVLPGIGHVYIGQVAKALVFLAALVGCLYGASEGALFPLAFLVPFLYLFCAIDAYRAAEELNARALGTASCGTEIVESPWWGASLMLLGLVLLLHNLGWIDVAALRRYWPVALIVAGGVSLGSSFVRRRTRVGEA
jgi:hypothetical protein